MSFSFHFIFTRFTFILLICTSIFITISLLTLVAVIFRLFVAHLRHLHHFLRFYF